MKYNNLFLSLAVLFLVACGAKKENDLAIVRPVKVAQIESTSNVSRNFSGVVEAITASTLAFRVSGQVINFPIATGQKVRKGDLIAELDTRELALQFSADKAAYETALAQFDRSKRLVDKQAISQQEFEINKANYEKTKSAFENSKNNMRDSKLYAPYSGSIEETYINDFERISAGTPIVKLINSSDLQLVFTMPDNSTNLLQSNSKFTVEFDIIKNQKFNAKLKQFVDVSSDGSGIPVRLLIDDPTFKNMGGLIKPGFSCNIQIDIDVKKQLGTNIITIPLSAIYSDAELKSKNVWVVTNNTVSLRKVELSKLIGEESVVVSNGLSVGETIVIAGVTQLKEGDKVSLIQ